jgi:multisubunit Na+/H+ antiporter MnhF subunit
MCGIEIVFITLMIFLAIVVLGLIRHRNPLIKILFLNTTTTIVSLVFCTLGSFKANNSYIDIAVIYFLLSYVATLAYLRYFL